MSESEDRDPPVLQKASSSKQQQVDESGDVQKGMTFSDLLYRSRDKIKIAIIGGISAAFMILIYWKIGWMIPVTFGVSLIPAIFGFRRIITVPSKLVMEYKRKLEHFDLYSIPNKLFRHFDIDPRTAKLTAGSNHFVFLCSNADLENFQIETAWPAGANPLDFRVDEDAYMELATRFELMSKQDLENIAIPQALGMEKARENSRRLDEHDFDDLPEDYMELKKQRPTEAYDRLRRMKKVGNNDG
ncbi:MAG: hypothetical protein ACLFT7_08680 [Thermoplasmata archaeon]